MAKYSSKPGVDWKKVKERVQAGQSFRNIEEAIGTVTHQAISKRARKEGWTEEARLEQVASNFKPTGQNGNSGIGNKLAIIAALEKGVPLKVAAGAIGISDRTLREWRESDAAFSAECENAQLKFVQANLEEIDKASKRGDWKAAVWLLGKHPKSKADYAEEKATGGPSVQIVLSIPKPGEALEVIEAKSELVEIDQPALPSPETDDDVKIVEG